VLTVEPQVIERYVRPGAVRLLFRDVLNHGERSERTSEAAIATGLQGQFWQMHELLFNEQDTIAATAPGELVALSRSFAARLDGLDGATFASQLESRAALPSLKAADAEQRKRGINSQPIFQIGTQRLVGYQSIEAMARALDAALKG
jgi:protein-disulfide isomerase